MFYMYVETLELSCPSSWQAKLNFNETISPEENVSAKSMAYKAHKKVYITLFQPRAHTHTPKHTHAHTMAQNLYACTARAHTHITHTHTHTHTHTSTVTCTLMVVSPTLNFSPVAMKKRKAMMKV